MCSATVLVTAALALTAATAPDISAEPPVASEAEGADTPAPTQTPDAASEEATEPVEPAPSAEPDPAEPDDPDDPEPVVVDAPSPEPAVPRPVGPPLTPTETVAPPSREQAPHPLRVRWGITGPLVGTTAVGFALFETLGGLRPAPVVCTPPVDGTCPDLGPLEPIDGLAVGHYNGAASTASDALVYLGLAGSLAVSLAESISWARAEGNRGVARHRRRGAARFGTDTAIFFESVGVAMVVTNVIKDAVGRPRPLTHLGEAALAAEGVEIDGDFGRSFPSGHATLAFSSAAAGSMLLTLKQCRPTEGRRPRCGPRSTRERVALGLMWGLSMAAATTTATLRVVAGKHYPTDVLMGSLLGATSGVVIPLLHDRRWR